MLGEIEAEAYLNKISKSGCILGLESMQRLMEELLNVHRNISFIHVAGTNGKGSVCAMISSILMEAGLKVGTYTSPAVFDRKEQYQINGIPVSSHEFAALITEVKQACERLCAKGYNHPTVFEVETAAAFLYFFQNNCQIAVLETGMGGETDATNIIEKPLVSVLTSISMDHRKFLGDTLEQIAKVKAGIVKEGCPVVAIKPKQAQVCEVLENICNEKHAVLTYAEAKYAEDVQLCGVGEKSSCLHNKVQEAATNRFDEQTDSMFLSFQYKKIGKISLSMAGIYQVENAICAIETVKVLRASGFNISDNQIEKGLQKAKWQGRFSVLCQEPLFVMDGAHNEDAAEKLRQTLKMGFTNYKIIYIIGVLADKEHKKMLETMLPLAQSVFTVTPKNPRAMEGQALAQEAAMYHNEVTYCSSIKEAVDRALQCARQDKSMILAFGSLSYLGELREAFKEKES